MRGSCFDMEAAPSAEEPKAEVPANPETKEASEVKAEVAEEGKEAAEAGHVINLLRFPQYGRYVRLLFSKFVCTCLDRQHLSSGVRPVSF